ncbi:hypothetical protein AB4084_37600, partial [Lysobacter sp. 2RAB21]
GTTLRSDSMKVLNDSEVQTVSGAGIADVFPRSYYNPSDRLLQDPYWAQQWALWGRDRIGGYPN